MSDLLPFAKIALAIPVRELFDYDVPEHLRARVLPGARVRVPFGASHRIGYCIERAAASVHAKTKSVAEVLDDEPLLDPHLLALTRWTAQYYLCAQGEVIECAVPRQVRARRAPLVRWVRLRAREDASLAVPRSATKREARRQSALAVLEQNGGELTLDALGEQSQLSAQAIKTLARDGLVEIFRAPVAATLACAAPNASTLSAARAPDSRVAAPELSAPQRDAVTQVLAAITAQQFKTFLLHGVTGSGKTEVYLQCIERALALGRGAVVLLPEIALTPQTVRRFEERLGAVAVLHSLLSDRDRGGAYERLRTGAIRVAIGARSAVFAPIARLGLIVVDECHESSYKQESAPRYHAGDVAVLRASQLGIPCLLGSATPTLEQLHNARTERFKLLSLPERVTRHALPDIEIVDRRAESPSEGGGELLFSPRLLARLEETLGRDEQAILFLNRRGYARNIHCPRCGYSMRCGACDIALTYHRGSDRSLCHYCGAEGKVPARCPDCDSAQLRRSLAGTERIETILEKLFPGVSCGRLDRDTVTSEARLVEILDDFTKGRTRLLIGTQMLAKGHDIPGVTLVGVVDADVALNMPDFRAAERTMQLLCQVAGRAGRGARPGKVVIQTRQPLHYAIEAARRQDPSYLYKHESAIRKQLGYPPFGYLVRIVCEDRDEERCVASAAALAAQLSAALVAGVRLLGPAPAPLPRLRDRFRYHLLLKGQKRDELNTIAQLAAFERPRWKTTRVAVDVDPQQML
ncbi:MAG: primosomal protein N' [Planctomycetota bacterium]